MPLQVLGNEPVKMPRPGADTSLTVTEDNDTFTSEIPTENETETETVTTETVSDEAPADIVEADEAEVHVEEVIVDLHPVTEALTEQDQDTWGSLLDRLFDETCTEVNILANDLVVTDPYHVVVNIDTVYYDDPDIHVTSEASMRRIIDAFIVPNSNLDVPPGKPLPPIVDGTFLITDTFDGVTDDVRARIQVLSPPATYRTELHFCKLPKTDIDLHMLMDYGTMPADIAYFLSAVTKAGVNIIFSGIPNTGKTTVLNACTYEIPSSEKVAVIQDVDELTLQHLHTKQKLFTHRAVAKSIDSISDGSASSLIEVVKRTRPTRLFTGECRSGEMYDHLEASSIFHGCMTTIHASNAEQALINIQNMAAKNPYAPNIDGIRALIASGVDLVVQLGLYKKRRIVTEVMELDGTITDQGIIRRHHLWQFDPEDGSWVKGTAGPGERILRKLAVAEQPDYWRNSPRLS